MLEPIFARDQMASERVQIAAKSDTAAGDAVATAYRNVLRIRRLEEACLDLRRRELIAGSIHLCAGQEAIPAGATAAMHDNDRVIATYRGHGWALACGVPLRDLLAEICQRPDGINGGRGGSPYLVAPRYRFLGENSVVGAGVPIAAGVALATRTLDTGGVVIVSFGDGAMNQGALQEGLVFAAYEKLPLVLVCENNGWSEMTPTAKIARPGNLVRRAQALDIDAVSIDGSDPMVVEAAVASALQAARHGGGPTFIDCRCHRLWGHYNADIEHYRSEEDRELAEAADPVARLREQLTREGENGNSRAELIEREVERELSNAIAAVTDGRPAAFRGAAKAHVVGAPAPARKGGEGRAVELSYVRAVNQALRQELAERPEVVVFGEDVGQAGGIFGATRQLQEEFGEARVFDTPIAEAAILGSAVGASIAGLRPVVEIMWADFLLVALDQLVNQAANVRYVSQGQLTAPLVVRTQQGVTPGSCAQHSQSLEALLAHIPGIRVGLPSTPQDAYSMLRAAVADDDPVVVIEARSLYQTKGEVVLDGRLEGLGGARRVRTGADAGVITWGTTLHTALRAADDLAAEGIDVSVLDVRWLAPLDDQAIEAIVIDSGGRIVVAHEANVTGGFGAEIVARITQRHFDLLDAPVLRVGTPDVRIPSAPALQSQLVPDAEAISAAVRTLIG
jgi:2-oxoisovalerate dehydrogenase E1 component